MTSVALGVAAALAAACTPTFALRGPPGVRGEGQLEGAGAALVARGQPPLWAGTVDGALGGAANSSGFRPRGFVRVNFGPTRFPDSRTANPYPAVDPRIGARWHASVGRLRMALEVNDASSPWYCVLDHWTPHDSGKVVLTSALFNDMKSDLSEKEFWYYVLQFADYKDKHKEVRKKKNG